MFNSRQSILVPTIDLPILAPGQYATKWPLFVYTPRLIYVLENIFYTDTCFRKMELLVKRLIINLYQKLSYVH